jgi:putative PIN family toxin of toxin-antitoxin system
MRRERVVLDTNVLISGVLSASSTPSRALEVAVRQAQLLASAATLRELMATMLAPRFDPYLSREKRDALLLRFAPLVEIVEVVQRVRACRDPKDDQFLEVSVNGRADLIVTGDGDLLTLDPFRGVAILTPAAYLARAERAASSEE